MKTKNWSRWKLVKYSAILFFFLFLLAELIIRVHFLYKYKGTGTSIAVQGNTIQMADSFLVFKNRPFYTDYNLRFQFNEEGMKSAVTDAFIPEKTTKDFWVFLFGASAMEGMGSNKTGAWIDITGVQDYRWEETVAFLLQTKLQQSMPDKIVKVFCAANSSYSIYQSLLKYQQLSRKYKIDWIVSLDGNNEPPELDTNLSIHKSIETDWQTYPIHNYPTTLIVPFTKHLAVINYAKQFVYDLKQKKREYKNINSNFPERKYWFAKEGKPIKFDTISASMRNALQIFINETNAFDSILTSQNKKHLLLIQPHISLRNKSLADTTERAVYNYYLESGNNPVVNMFQKQIHDSLLYKSSNIYVLNELHEAAFPVFVDYCHFTSSANNFLVSFIAKRILADP